MRVTRFSDGEMNGDATALEDAAAAAVVEVDKMWVLR